MLSTIFICRANFFLYKFQSKIIYKKKFSKKAYQGIKKIGLYQLISYLNKLNQDLMIKILHYNEINFTSIKIQRNIFSISYSNRFYFKMFNNLTSG